MREMWKRRWAVMLSVLLVFPYVLALLPMAKLETEASRSITSMSWKFYTNGKSVKVEAGQTFYVGDFVSVYFNTGGYETASMGKASYTSSNKKVASVDSKGKMKTLAVGTTTIKVSYKGKKITQKFQVVKKGTLTQDADIKKLAKAADQLPASIPSKVTVKNGFSLFDKYIQFYQNYNKIKPTVNDSGILFDYTTGVTTLNVPKAGRYQTLYCILNAYAQKNNPTATRGAKILRVSSASANTGKSTVTLSFSSKVTKEQVLAGKIFNAQLNTGISMKALDHNGAYVNAYVRSGDQSYTGIVQLKAGSNKAVMKLYSYNYKTEKYKAVKLQKGKTYELGNQYSWPCGTNVTAN